MRDWAPFLLIEAIIELVRVERQLRRAPFHQVVKGLRPGGSTVLPAVLVDRVVRSVQWAAARMPFKAECLQIALATHRLLARRGHPVTFHLGAQKIPFAAHAWVTSLGEVLTDRPEVVQRYPELLRI